MPQLAFALGTPSSGARQASVKLAGTAATCSGVPWATMRPPASPPSGPRSITQSAVLITSRWCSITTIVTSFSASTSWTMPRPVRAGQASCGELNEDSRGDSSVSAKPQRGQEWRDENLNDGGGPGM